jgi:hypothetical protein
MVRHTVLTIGFCLLCVSACTPGNRLSGENNMFRALPGGEFILHKEIPIAPERVRASFQDGTAAYGYSESYPHCDLVLPTISEEQQIIPAGSYRIGRVIGQTHYVTRPQPGPVLLAAAGVGGSLLASDTGEGWIMFAYHVSLHAETPPERLTLVCGGAYDYPFYVKYPSLAEMQASLGEYATLKLP